MFRRRRAEHSALIVDAPMSRLSVLCSATGAEMSGHVSVVLGTRGNLSAGVGRALSIDMPTDSSQC